MNAAPENAVAFLIADDDEAYRVLLRTAFESVGVSQDHLRYVKDGQELMDYLLRRGEYEDAQKSPRPQVLLLDLNMPKKSGLEALKEIRAHSEWHSLPVLVLTVSRDEKDIKESYASGANSFLTKPVSWDHMRETLSAVYHYWFQVASLPSLF